MFPLFCVPCLVLNVDWDLVVHFFFMIGIFFLLIHCHLLYRTGHIYLCDRGPRQLTRYDARRPFLGFLTDWVCVWKFLTFSLFEFHSIVGSGLAPYRWQAVWHQRDTNIAAIVLCKPIIFHYRWSVLLLRFSVFYSSSQSSKWWRIFPFYRKYRKHFTICDLRIAVKCL